MEKKGVLTSDVPTKFQSAQNIFYFETAPDPSYSAPIEELHRFNINDLIQKLKDEIVHRSSSGIKAIARIFKNADINGNGQLEVDDFRWGFIDYGIDFLTHEDAMQLLKHFDADNNGTVSFAEFLRAIKVSTLAQLVREK